MTRKSGSIRASYSAAVLLALGTQLYALQLVTARLGGLDGIVGTLTSWTGDHVGDASEPIRRDVSVKPAKGEAEAEDHDGDDDVNEELEHEEDCNAESLESKPGMAWNKDYGWRYETSVHTDPLERYKENHALREEAYLNLVKGTSPWPDWFEPTVSLLPEGTMFQMAMSAAQKDTRPGGFGTFDEIDTLTEVRDDLAVLQAWKPDVQRVNVYRVALQLPVYVGPVGPQVDPEACVLLPGRFSQFQMLVKKENRMKHIELVSSHPIKQEK